MQEVRISYRNTIEPVKKLVDELDNEELKGKSLEIIRRIEEIYAKANHFRELASAIYKDWQENYSIYRKTGSDIHQKMAKVQYVQYRKHLEKALNYYEAIYYLVDNIIKIITLVEENRRIDILNTLADMANIDPVAQRAKYLKYKDRMEKMMEGYSIVEEGEEIEGIDKEMEKEFRELEMKEAKKKPKEEVAPEKEWKKVIMDKEQA
ncbi:hypothetical protein Shell_0485 [Staphylothermus hellenicus DSM 12710]|uniref:Uncharacterized protein n=2 Tax=Staphylothermus hellenicus TaxID=84599 RepID=D7DBR9_STAHD|nr:hypothetical protein Shell_0485 [Staphylothermus hellenicus DSM 12710]